MQYAEKGNKILASFEERVGVVRNAEISRQNATLHLRYGGDIILFFKR